MTFFDEHAKSEIRHKNKYFTFKNPTVEQELHIREVMQGSMKNVENSEGEDEILGTFDYELIRWIIIELTNVGEGLKDISGEDFVSKIEKGDFVVKELMFHIEGLLSEIGTDLTREQGRLIDTVEQTIDLLMVGNKMENTKDKIVKMFKKKGINLPAEECLALLGNPEELTKALEGAVKTKPKSKPSPTRSKKKK